MTSSVHSARICKHVNHWERSSFGTDLGWYTIRVTVHITCRTMKLIVVILTAFVVATTAKNATLYKVEEPSKDQYIVVVKVRNPVCYFCFGCSIVCSIHVRDGMIIDLLRIWPRRWMTNTIEKVHIALPLRCMVVAVSDPFWWGGLGGAKCKCLL